ncbi:MAG: hypothetical protein ACI8RZ_001473 [Myxococcota bacterium]|jgi:hypothetical protein
MPEVAITLKIVGAGEDYPRLLTGYRSFRGGVQVALAMRPMDKRILLSVSQKDGTAALLHAVGQDGATWPTGDSTTAEVSKLLKAAQQKLPKAGPIVMRGQWRAKLYTDIEAQTVRVVLVRKIASYGTLTITGTRGGWTFRFERAARWFADGKGSGSMSGANYKTLIEATQRGYSQALDLVGEACGTKDTKRRQALDPAYAAQRPTRAPKVRASEPLDRFKLPKPTKGKTPRKKAGSCNTNAKDCKTLTAGGRPIPVAKTAPALAKQAAALKADAEALASTAAPKVAMSVDAVINHFINRGSIEGYNDLAERIRDYTRGTHAPLDRTVPLDDFIAQLRTDAKKALDNEWKRYGDANNSAATYAAEDEAAITALDMALRSAPVQLARARSLIRFAQAATASSKCSGPEEAEARQAIARAEASYEEARKALVKGGEKAALKPIRQAAAWLALSASKISASCGVGQQGLLGRTPKKAPAKKATAPTTPATPRFIPPTFTVPVPQSSNKKAAFAAAEVSVSSLVKPASARGMLDFSKPVRGSWDLMVTARSQLTANALERGLPGLDLSTPAPASKKTTRKPRAKKAAAGGMSTTDAALMAAFQNAITAAVGASV